MEVASRTSRTRPPVPAGAARNARGFFVVAAAALTLHLGGCASTGPSAAPQPAQDDAALPGRDACFWTRSVYDWTVLDASTLIVNARGPHDYFLVKLFAPVPDLPYQVRLGFESKGGDLDRFCRGNGYVISRDSMRIREPVAAVHAITELEARQLRAAGPAAQRAPSGAGNAGSPGR